MLSCHAAKPGHGGPIAPHGSTRDAHGVAGYCVVLQSRFEDPTDAQGIIARGPEALQSQFSSGFGMVLNLLHSRSMDEARAFVQRSFNNYLGARSWVPPIVVLT